MPSDRLSYDTGTSQQVQGDLLAVVGQLEALIGQRDTAVSAAMSDFQADGVSDEYAVVAATDQVSLAQELTDDPALAIKAVGKVKGHRRNILNCSARAIGVGVVPDGGGRLYWTQVFGSRA